MLRVTLAWQPAGACGSSEQSSFQPRTVGQGCSLAAQAPQFCDAMYFRDRADTGRQVVARLQQYANRPDLLILGAAARWATRRLRGGQGAGAILHVFLVRKLRVPGEEEFAMGAVASGGTRVLNTHVVGTLNIPQDPRVA